MSKLDRVKRLAESTPDQYERPLNGTLVLDGDGLVYEACATAAKLETAVRRFKTKVFELMYLTKCGTARVHLTSKDCWKNGRAFVHSSKPYQANRKGKAKPPLLEATREAVAQDGVFLEHEGVTIILNRLVEADDAMMQDAYSVPDAVVYSPDKDLRIVPCPWYDPKTGQLDKIKDRYGYIDYYLGNTTPKVIGHGTAFFWAQMLMGDTADNVQGIRRWYGKLCGPAKAYDVLHECKTESEAANTVLDAYRFGEQNPLPEAHCLWLLRTSTDTAEGYIWSLDLSTENREFIQHCFNLEWKFTPEATQEPEQEPEVDLPWET